jgi:hypothetical protein
MTSIRAFSDDLIAWESVPISSRSEQFLGSNHFIESFFLFIHLIETDALSVSDAPELLVSLDHSYYQQVNATFSS